MNVDEWYQIQASGLPLSLDRTLRSINETCRVSFRPIQASGLPLSLTETATDRECKWCVIQASGLPLVIETLRQHQTESVVV